MMAAVVEPVGLKANWSINHNEGGGDDNAHITPDHNSLNNAGKFWCDRYRPIVRGLLRCRSFWDRPDVCLLPLVRYRRRQQV